MVGAAKGMARRATAIRQEGHVLCARYVNNKREQRGENGDGIVEYWCEAR